MNSRHAHNKTVKSSNLHIFFHNVVLKNIAFNLCRKIIFLMQNENILNKSGAAGLEYE